MSEKVFKNVLAALKTARKELQNNKLISDENRKELNDIISNADAPITLLIMGEFSTGKSTFINASVGKEIAAVGALPTTAVITKLCYGEEDKITIYFKDGKSKVYGQDEFAQITSETDDSKYKKIRKNIKYVERAMPMDILQYISIIDSPGLNALNETHADITKDFMDNADAVLWMFSAKKAGAYTEFAAIETLNPRLKPIAIINQIDTIDPEEESIETFLNDIKNKLKGKVLDVIGISSLMAYKGKTTGNEMLVEESNIRAVQNAMEEKVIPNRYDFKLKSLLDELGSFIWDVKTGIDEFKENLEEQKEQNYDKYITEKSVAVETEAILEKIILSVKDYCIEHAGLQNTPAAFVLNILYYYGLSVDKNESKALEAFESIAIKNHCLAQKFLSITYANKRSFEKAFYWTKKAVEYGDKECQYALAELYFDGLGTKKNEAEAVKWYKKSAEQGYVEAQCILANCYLNGLGIAINLKEAAKWYKKAAEQGFAKAQYNLASCYFYGKGLTENKLKATKWYKKAAEQGYRDAQSWLGTCYEEGWGVKRNEEEAIKWYKKATAQGDERIKKNLEKLIALQNINKSKELYAIAKRYHVENNVKLAFEYYEKAAELNNVDAQNILGRCYKEGWVVEKNYTESMKWYKKAADQGSAEAQCSLAKYYFEGNGIDKDETKALMLYKEAAAQGYEEAKAFLIELEQKNRRIKVANEFSTIKYRAESGDKESQYRLGRCYEIGENIVKNYEEAFKWYKKAADNGHVLAQERVGHFIENGIAVSKDINIALQWYQLAANQGYIVAANRLKLLNQSSDINNFSNNNATILYESAQNYYKKGEFPKAVEYYRKAAEIGLPEAQNSLGVCYQLGIGVTENYREAISWYKKSAEQGFVKGQFNLAQCYDYGWGINKNLSEALKWYKKAAEQGYAAAYNRIYHLSKENNNQNNNANIQRQIAAQSNGCLLPVIGLLAIIMFIIAL